MTIENFKTAGLIILTSFLLLGYAHYEKPEGPVNNINNIEITENIKLYSNGKLVGEWTGIGRGQMNGSTYTFKTERGAFSNEMRISGDFVIETTTR